MKELNELKEKINNIIEQSNTDKPACKNCKRYCDVKYNISENTKDNLRGLLSDVERINEDVTNLNLFLQGKISEDDFNGMLM